MWIESDPEFHYWVVSGHLKLYDMGRVGSGRVKKTLRCVVIVAL